MWLGDLLVIRHLRAAGLDPREDEPLSRHGYWRIGGPADVLVTVTDIAGLRVVLTAGAPVTVLGAGSNLLVADEGVRGIVVRLQGDFLDTEFLGALSPQTGVPETGVPETGVPENGRGDRRVIAGGGLRNTVLLARLKRADLGGLASLAGVPGTVGGAIRMNAGTSLGEIGDAVLWVEIMLPGGEIERLIPDRMSFRYRHASLPTGAVITRAALRVRPTDDAETARIRAHLARRKATQPLDRPSCGSVFKNPPGDHAGRLIEAAGLKGARVGGAQISPRHANFIVNTGGALAMDVYTLVRRARDTVRERFGVVLEPEVHAIGDWPRGLWPLPADCGSPR